MQWSRATDAVWTVGRAEMLYRDLIPDRMGGAFVASHIRITQDGPVPDYVHHHGVAFQMIYCVAGSARLVYEDQGPPFEFVAGSCVLQPPGIRHRVLESRGLEVVEVTSPAEHQTSADPIMELPTGRVDRLRRWNGQRFVHYRVGVEDGEMAEATSRLASTRIVRGSEVVEHDADLCLWFVLAGTALLGDETLARHDAVVLGRGERHVLDDASDDLELLEVRVNPPQGL